MAVGKKNAEQILREYLRHNGGDEIAHTLIHAADTARIPISWGCALVQGESGFRNMFGHDPVRNTTGGRVTRARYRLYKIRRRRGWGMQGVGYTQLTWFAYQDQADMLGGCWRAYPNMVVGFRLLRNLVDQHGMRLGAARFNGTGPAAEAYGLAFTARANQWHDRLT